MTADLALLRSVIDYPDDDVPRLIYADWLEDHGDWPRAEFIRVQCEMTQQFGDGGNLGQAFALRRRQRELLGRFEKDWVRDIRGRVSSWTFERGFVVYVALTARAFLAHAESLFAMAPIRRLNLMSSDDILCEVLQSPYLTRLSVLYLPPFSPTDMEAIVASPNLESLNQLFVNMHRRPADLGRLQDRFGESVRVG